MESIRPERASRKGMTEGHLIRMYLSGKQMVERMKASSEESLENIFRSLTFSSMTSSPRRLKGSAPTANRFPPFSSWEVTLFQQRQGRPPHPFSADATM